MPSLGFEVYCGTCNEGLCQSTTVSGSTVTVECFNCSNKISELENEIDTLEDEINTLNDTINDLTDELDELKEPD